MLHVAGDIADLNYASSLVAPSDCPLARSAIGSCSEVADALEKHSRSDGADGEGRDFVAGAADHDTGGCLTAESVVAGVVGAMARREKVAADPGAKLAVDNGARCSSTRIRLEFCRWSAS